MLHDLQAHRREDLLFAITQSLSRAQGSSLASFYGNPLDDIDPVSALVPDFFSVEWLHLSGCVRRPDTQLMLAGARLPPHAPRCPAVASDRISQVRFVPGTAAISAELDPLDRAETRSSATFYLHPSGLYVPLRHSHQPRLLTITKTPRPESRGKTLSVASVFTNLRGRR
jgi:hypothetical protein